MAPWGDRLNKRSVGSRALSVCGPLENWTKLP
jgi:hypothetical protein